MKMQGKCKWPLFMFILSLFLSMYCMPASGNSVQIGEIDENSHVTINQNYVGNGTAPPPAVTPMITPSATPVITPSATPVITPSATLKIVSDTISSIPNISSSDADIKKLEWDTANLNFIAGGFTLLVAILGIVCHKKSKNNQQS